MSVHPGDIIRWQGESHQVVAIRSTYLTLRSVDGDGDDVEVLAADLRHEVEPAAPASLRSLLDLRSLQDLDARDRKIVDVWLEELARFDELVAAGVTKPTARQQIIDNVNRCLGTDYSPVKVSRQQRALEEFGVSGLLDRRRHGLADMPGRSYDERLIDAILTVQAGQERKSTGTGTRLIWLVRRELDDRFGEGVVPMPSRATMYRLLSELDAGKHTLGTARARRTTANQPDHMHGVRSGVRPGEQVLIDTTPMEILVECDGEPVRPDLTLLLCEASRSVLSGIVTVGSRSIDLVVVLARAIVPYASRPDGVRANRRQVSEAWTGTDGFMVERFEAMRDAQPYVFPESITTDRGASYVSRHFSDAWRTLGISLTVNAEYSPTQKAKIERMFRTVKDLFTQYAIAFLGQSTDMRGDEIIATSQLLTLEQLQELFEDWVAVTWQSRPHKALRDPRNPRLMLTPNQMIAAYREIAPELQVPLTAEKYIALLPTEWRVINHYGVDIDLRVYDSTELGPLRKEPLMRALSALVGPATAVAFAAFAAPSTAEARADSSCVAPARQSEPVAADRVEGMSATVCELVGQRVVSGGIEVDIPEPGTAVTAQTSGDASAHYLHVEVAKSGLISVDTFEPELRYTELLKDGSSRDLEASEALSDLALAYSRCSDWSYSTSAWFSPSIFYLNSSERRPSNISKSAFESIAVASLSTWKNGTNGCGISRALDVPGSISYGNWTYDGNFTSAGGCGTRDSRNVIDWGPLAGSTLGLTCTWSINGAPVEKDIRLDTSSRSWVTTATGCSGAYDVRSVLTHEMGHGLALGHAAENGGNDLTMSPNISTCNTSARVLGAGDVTAIYVQHGG